ncbi:MAG: hypothetical protein WCT19_02220 [Candidatus Paceibacterota bacterium]
MNTQVDMAKLEQTACEHNESVKDFQRFVDKLAKLFASTIPSQAGIDLPGDYVFQCWPSGEYKLCCKKVDLEITAQVKSHDDLEYFAGSINNGWLLKVIPILERMTKTFQTASQIIESVLEK